ncbi:sodium:proton antiporter [Solirubrobacter ginsenosidimutans]|uniref:Sodium:proton antiporter n=1 Tax=Solirubrobacter ginsenosidimutans TaxID=490573 RepID=A0A9X3S4U6_9ACTN|nr:sodium:proton antiporter [Solirubrobacter ginsenosidimutans]MDA0167055.1 sodium:proton antiporter [Solirubrobacter ginsenosidimutans]
MTWALAIVALTLLAVAAVSRRLTGTPVTPAIVFVAVGLLVGPEVLGGIDLESSSATVRALAEATLALVLFCDASRIDLGQLRREIRVPERLLGIGLPLTIALGTLAALAIFDQLTVEEAVILAVVLAPTDAALGQAVVTEPRIPGRIRQGLNVESGLNDGICVPLLFAAVAVADVESEISEGRSAGTLLLEEIGYGVIGGVVGGLVVAAIIIHAGRRELIADAWRQVIPASGAALAYGTASALGGSGFIAAFVAGMTFRLVLGRDPGHTNELSEQLGNVLNGVTFVLFGAILLGPALGELSWELALYAVLSLTLVRMLPVAIAMLGTKARTPTLGFLGWFGPRGLASIVFAVIVVEESNLPHEHLIVLAIYLTVGLSVFAHGLTAAPLANRYARWYEQHPRDQAPPMESAPTDVTRARGPAPQGADPTDSAARRYPPNRISRR